MKNVYFLSDAHLGSRAIEHGRTQERRLVNFLDSIKHKAAAVYLLGDMFDFWYEFKTVVPRGYTRFLGKLSELTDLGVEVHFFIGNHDIWCGGNIRQGVLPGARRRLGRPGQEVQTPPCHVPQPDLADALLRHTSALEHRIWTELGQA